MPRFNGTPVEKGPRFKGAPLIDPAVSAEADAYEKVRGTSSFADATDASMAGLPFADELTSAIGAPFRAAGDWMGGRGFDVGRAYTEKQAVNKELERRRDERHPVATTAGELAGGLGIGGVMAKSGLTFLQAAKPTILSLMGRGAAEGAAYGAAYGAGEGEGFDERKRNAEHGAVISALLGAGTGALARIGAGGVADDAAPAADDLRTLAKQAYQAADNAGVVYTPEGVQQLGQGIMEDMAAGGFHPRIHPKVAAVLDAVGELGDGNVSLGKLEQLRRIAGSAAKSIEPDEQRLASIVIDNIDEFTRAATDPALVARGDGAVASDALTEARDYWSRLRKSEMVDDALMKAERHAKSTGGGTNIDNASRQKVRVILDSPKKVRGFTDQERAVMERLVRGTTGQNLLRLIGKASPSGIVSGGAGAAAGATVGGAIGGPAGAVIGTVAVPAVGRLAKLGADAMTAEHAKVLDALVRNGGQALPLLQLDGPRKAIIDLLSRAAGQELPRYTGR